MSSKYTYISEVEHDVEDLTEIILKRIDERRTPRLSKRQCPRIYEKNMSYHILKQIQLQEYVRSQIVEVTLTNGTLLPCDNRYYAYENLLYKDMKDDYFELDIAPEFLKILHHAFNVPYDIRVLNAQYTVSEINKLTELAHCILYQTIGESECEELIRLLEKLPKLLSTIRNKVGIGLRPEGIDSEVPYVIFKKITPIVTEIVNMVYKPIYTQGIINGAKLSIVSADGHRILVRTSASAIQMKLRIRDHMYIVEGVKITNDCNN